MINVMIVEDEMLVRIGLKNSVNWDKLGMRVIADVSNGQAAWEVFQTEKLNIILTDIKMPVMDGIELIRRVRAVDSRVEIVVLSVLEEFDYVRKAMNLGVADYIPKLKMSIEEIEDLLARVAKKMSPSAEEQVSHAQLGPFTDEIQMKENMIKDYLFSGRYSDIEFELLAERAGFRIDGGRCLVMLLVSINQYENIEKKFKDSHGNLIRFSILNILGEIVAGFGNSEVFHEKNERFLVLCGMAPSSPGEISRRIEGLVDHIGQVLYTYLGSTAITAMSGTGQGYPSIRSLYKQCSETLKIGFFASGQKLLRESEVLSESLSITVKEKIVGSLDTLDNIPDAYHAYLQSSYLEMKAEQFVIPIHVRSLFLKWVHWSTLNMNLYSNEITHLALEYAEKIHRCQNIDEAMEWFRWYLAELNPHRVHKKMLSKEVAAAVTYMETHFSQELSLQEVAVHVHISPNYLSSLFRKDMQITFVEFLNQIRIERAKDLLINTFMRSYEISRAVGYADESYFSRIFKRMTGMRPNLFRKKWVADDLPITVDIEDDEDH